MEGLLMELPRKLDDSAHRIDRLRKFNASCMVLACCCWIGYWASHFPAIVIADSDLGIPAAAARRDGLVMFGIAFAGVFVAWRVARACLVHVGLILILSGCTCLCSLRSTSSLEIVRSLQLGCFGMLLATEHIANSAGRVTSARAAGWVLSIPAIFVVADVTTRIELGLIPANSLDPRRDVDFGQQSVSIGMGDATRFRSNYAGVEFECVADQGSLRAWRDGTLVLNRPVDGNERSVDVLAFSEKEQLLAAAWNHREYAGSAIEIWKCDDVKMLHNGSAQLIQRISGSGHWCYSMDFSPDGQRLIIANGDGIVRMWNLVTAEEMHHVSARSNEEWTGFIECIMFSRDGRTIAAWGVDRITLTNSSLEVEKEFVTKDVMPVSVGFGGDGDHVVAVGLRDGVECVLTWKRHANWWLLGLVWSACGSGVLWIVYSVLRSTS